MKNANQIAALIKGTIENASRCRVVRRRRHRHVAAAIASTANRVCIHGSIASDAPDTAHSQVGRPTGASLGDEGCGFGPSQSGSVPISKHVAAIPSGNTSVAWKKNGAVNAQHAHPNHAPAALPVVRYARCQTSAVDRAATRPRNATTPG